MKKAFLTVLLFSIAINFCFGQKATKKDYENFRSTTTYFVQWGNPFSDYDETMEEAMKKYWNITEYEVISVNEFIDLCTQPNKSFIVLSDAEIDIKNLTLIKPDLSIPGSKAINCRMLSLILSDESGDLNKMADLGSIPLSDDEDEDEEYLFYIGSILQLMQNNVRYMVHNPNKDIRDYISENTSRLENSELFIPRNLLSSSLTERNFAKYYPYPYIIEDLEVLTSRFNYQWDQIIIHYAQFEEEGGTINEIIIMTGNGKPLYMDFYKSTNCNLRPNDLKELAKKHSNN